MFKLLSIKSEDKRVEILSLVWKKSVLQFSGGSGSDAEKNQNLSCLEGCYDDNRHFMYVSGYEDTVSIDANKTHECISQ